MSKIKRPMKAPSDPISDKALTELKYPMVGSPKLDGFRCVVDEIPLTSSMKPFPNDYVKEFLSHRVYDGLDGEILIGEPNNPHAFHNSSGALRTKNGTPDFTFYVFDHWKVGGDTYSKRWMNATSRYQGLPRLVVLKQTLLRDAQEVLDYEAEMLAMGYEGAMIRSLFGTYKEGRCTYSEMNIFKRKPYVECEAKIIGVEEGTTNTNEKFLDERGLSKRSAHKDGKVPNGTLGAFILKSDLWEKEFRARAGEGYNSADKKLIWDARESYIGQIAVVKYQKYGSWEAPRQPSVIKIRPKWDITNG